MAVSLATGTRSRRSPRLVHRIAHHCTRHKFLALTRNTCFTNLLTKAAAISPVRPRFTILFTLEAGMCFLHGASRRNSTQYGAKVFSQAVLVVITLQIQSRIGLAKMNFACSQILSPMDGVVGYEERSQIISPLACTFISLNPVPVLLAALCASPYCWMHCGLTAPKIEANADCCSRTMLDLVPLRA